MATRKNYYVTLGVAPDAEAVVIRAAYKALSQRYHPDKCPPAERAAAHGRMSAINEAFDVLGDPARRRSYDEGQSREPRRSEEPSPVPSASRTGGRFVPLGIVIVATLLALQFAVEKKAWWTFTWEFISGGLHRPSSYSVNWILLIAIMGIGLRLAWTVHRRLARR